jgi:hypothetical protein
MVTKLLGSTLLLLGASALATAATVSAPEIDPGTGMSAIALVSGALLVIRSRHRK